METVKVSPLSRTASLAMGMLRVAEFIPCGTVTVDGTSPTSASCAVLASPVKSVVTVKTSPPSGAFWPRMTVISAFPPSTAEVGARVYFLAGPTMKRLLLEYGPNPAPLSPKTCTS